MNFSLSQRLHLLPLISFYIKQFLLLIFAYQQQCSFKLYFVITQFLVCLCCKFTHLLLYLICVLHTAFVVQIFWFSDTKLYQQWSFSCLFVTASYGEEKWRTSSLQVLLSSFLEVGFSCSRFPLIKRFNLIFVNRLLETKKSTLHYTNFTIVFLIAFDLRKLVFCSSNSMFTCCQVD